jgi:predicted RNase H-like nuclease (RuvC/YqgF family)
MNVSENLNIQNVIGDLKKSLQDKRSELSQCEAIISDFERQLQILDISLKEKIETNMILTTRLAGLFSSLETVEKKRDNDMRFHSNFLRKLQICDDIEKELRSKMHRETLNRLNNHIGIFNQMTEKSKISMHLGKGGEFIGTKEDIDEGLDNYVYPPYLLN